MSPRTVADVLAGLPEVEDWQLVPGADGDTLLVAGRRQVTDGATGRHEGEGAAEAATAGDVAVRGVELTSLPGLMRLLDDTALLAMARVLDRARLFRGGASHDTGQILAALGVVPRHAWIVRRWLTTLTAENRLAQDTASGRYHSLTVPDRQTYARARRALDEARRGLDYPASMTRFFLGAAERLPLLLQDRASLQELLFPDGETGTAEGNYRDSTPSRWVNHAAAALIAREARRYGPERPMRVLEVGAGVGGTTGAVFEALGDTDIDYLFTDVSRFFLQAGRDAFGARAGLRHALFDINVDPLAQGFAPASCDVVLAANVLHNARHAGRALAALRELLVPDGLLVLVESCREHYQALTSMYLLMSPTAEEAERTEGESGWFTDVRAGQDRVFLTEDEWTRQLDAAGFRPLPVLPEADHPLAGSAGQRVIAGRVGAAENRPDPAAVEAALTAQLTQNTAVVRVHAVDRLIRNPTTGETS